ncbi:MAG: strawberry notch family protein [Alphaproteobacteria bacterium]|nr:strawberry notch family protein [Alphaproteobacteria bacterium]
MAKNLAYAERLGLWRLGIIFDDCSDFISSIAKGSIIAMKVISRDMKTMGYTMPPTPYPTMG